MRRTEQQVKADDNLTQAIELVLEAYSMSDNDVLTDYLIICVQDKLGLDHESQMSYGYVFRNSEVPTHAAIGMLEVAKARLLHDLNKE